MWFWQLKSQHLRVFLKVSLLELIHHAACYCPDENVSYAEKSYCASSGKLYVEISRKKYTCIKVNGLIFNWWTDCGGNFYDQADTITRGCNGFLQRKETKLWFVCDVLGYQCPHLAPKGPKRPTEPASPKLIPCLLWAAWFEGHARDKMMVNFNPFHACYGLPFGGHTRDKMLVNFNTKLIFWIHILHLGMSSEGPTHW